MVRGVVHWLVSMAGTIEPGLALTVLRFEVKVKLIAVAAYAIERITQLDVGVSSTGSRPVFCVALRCVRIFAARFHTSAP